MRRCSRGADVPSVCQTRSLAKVRAQGKPGARCTRSLVCKSKKHTSKSPQVPPDRPACQRDRLTAYSMFSACVSASSNLALHPG